MLAQCKHRVRGHTRWPLGIVLNLYYTVVLMRDQRLLGGFETLLLLAVIRLDKLAYGVTVREELKREAGKDVAVGAIYTGLDRLEQKGFVESWSGDPTPERGGRAKRFYRVTASGVRALKETQNAIRKLSSGLTLEKLIWNI
jgi:PadR family transcriptional regulator PadR